MNNVTQILKAIEQGDSKASDDLLPLVYRELRQLAAQRLAQEPPGLILQPTALVHEAYVRLVDVEEAQKWDSRGHFFGAAAEAMRRILVENARRKRSLKAGGQLKRVDLEAGEVCGLVRDEELLALNEALQKLAEKDARAAKLVELRYFGGLTMKQAADVLEVSLGTALSNYSHVQYVKQGENGHRPRTEGAPTWLRKRNRVTRSQTGGNTTSLWCSEARLPFGLAMT